MQTLRHVDGHIQTLQHVDTGTCKYWSTKKLRHTDTGKYSNAVIHKSLEYIDTGDTNTGTYRHWGYAETNIQKLGYRQQDTQKH